MGEYELIDRTDNDSHDEGTREEMQAFADERNADEARVGGNAKRWTVKPAGYASKHFKGV